MDEKRTNTHVLELYPADGKDIVVCVMTGSDGGMKWARQIAGRFNDCGIPSCAMAYWKYKSLPKKLSLIPVEAVESAVKYLKDRGYKKVALYGISKGAELALLAASLLSGIDAVIAVSPPCAVFEGLSMRGYSGNSSWAFRGGEVPFIITADGKFNVLKMYFSEGGYAFLNSFTKAFDNRFSEENRIKIENAACPILLVSAASDSIWPSARMSGIIIDKLNEVGYKYPCRHISFERASHLLCPVRSVTRKIFPQERKYPGECEQARREAFAAAVDWVRGAV